MDLGGTRMSLPRLVLTPCMAVDTRPVPSLMDAVERDRNKGGSIKLLLDMESLGSVLLVIATRTRSELRRPSGPY